MRRLKTVTALLPRQQMDELPFDSCRIDDDAFGVACPGIVSACDAQNLPI
jgi:hypothetical protein